MNQRMRRAPKQMALPMLKSWSPSRELMKYGHGAIMTLSVLYGRTCVIVGESLPVGLQIGAPAPITSRSCFEKDAQENSTKADKLLFPPGGGYGI